MISSDLVTASARLSRELLALVHDEPTDADRVASGLAGAAATVLPDLDVVVTVVERTRSARASTAPPAGDLALVEARLGVGPTLCALEEARPMRGRDDATRWPREWHEAAERAGYADVVAVPIVSGRRTTGAVTVHGREEIAEDAVAIAELIAHQAALVVEGGRRLAQLRDAVTSRDVIGQAKGILMHRYGIDAATAFARLVEASQDMNVKLVDIARWYVTDQGDASSPRPT